MFISKNWLSEYVTIPENTDLLSLMTVHTAEVEEEKHIGQCVGIKVGYVQELEQHPNADKLRVAKIDLGDGALRTIVCGAQNLAIGQKVPVATPGTSLPNGITIQEAPLRGVISQGMICSLDELGLATERAAGILVLPADTPLGVDFYTHFQCRDTILEIDNKSITNRPDLFGHYGLARELSVLCKTPLQSHTITHSIPTDLPSLAITVEQSSTVKRFLGILIEDLDPEVRTPLWIEQRLRSMGERTIHPIVDITNYIMYDMGQPMHAFDSEKIEKNNLSIGHIDIAQDVIALDGKTYTLPESTLVIKNEHTPLAIAGIMGLESTGVQQDTTSVLLIADTFDPITIRKTTQALRLKTPGAIRQEKGIDPELASLAIEKAWSFIKQLYPACRITAIIKEYYPDPAQHITISTTYSFLKSRLGMDISWERIEEILTGLGFSIEKAGDKLNITVPSFRATGDISIAEDIVEELARITGYDNIPPILPPFPLQGGKNHDMHDLLHQIRTHLALSAHLYEVNNYSFYSRKAHQNARLSEDYHAHPIPVVNPLSEEQEIMRTSMIPLLVQDVTENKKHTNTFGCFEIDRIYRSQQDKKFHEEYRLGIAYICEKSKKTSTIYTEHPYFHVKKCIDELAQNLHITHLSWEPLSEQHTILYPWAHPKRSAVIIINDNIVGVCGEIHPEYTMNIDHETSIIVAAEIDPAVLLAHKQDPLFVPYALYPTVTRDFSFVVSGEYHVGHIMKYIPTLHTAITHVDLSDIYVSSEMNEGEMSITLSVTYENTSSSFTDEEIQAITTAILSGLQSHFGLQLRS